MAASENPGKKDWIREINEIIRGFSHPLLRRAVVAREINGDAKIDTEQLKAVQEISTQTLLNTLRDTWRDHVDTRDVQQWNMDECDDEMRDAVLKYNEFLYSELLKKMTEAIEDLTQRLKDRQN